MENDVQTNLREFQDYLEDVQRSGFQTFDDVFARFMSAIAPGTPLGGVAVRALPSVNFEKWYEPFKGPAGGFGTRSLNWPVETGERLALQLELLSRIDDGRVDFVTLCHRLTTSGKYDDMVHAITSQVERPFARDLVRLLHTQPEFRTASSSVTDAGALHPKFGILRDEVQLARDFAAANLADQPNGLIFFDIDYFKRLNTRFTETVVDRDILRPFQELISKLVRSRGHAYSVGGDEFIILLLNSDASETVAYCERLRGAVAGAPFACGAETAPLTITLGFAMFPDDASALDELRQKANFAENRAKDRGRDRVLAFSSVSEDFRSIAH